MSREESLTSFKGHVIKHLKWLFNEQPSSICGMFVPISIRKFPFSFYVFYPKSLIWIINQDIDIDRYKYLHCCLDKVVLSLNLIVDVSILPIVIGVSFTVNLLYFYIIYIYIYTEAHQIWFLLRIEY